MLIIRSIIHPTDFSHLSMDAFAHALRIAIATKSRLYLLHVAERTDDAEWSSFPSVRSLLARWGLIEESAPQCAVAERLGIRIAKIQLEPREPIRAIEEFITAHPSELIALGTHGREGIGRWLHGSIAESLSRRTRIMTLFMGSSSRGFVDPKTGVLPLRNILLPVDHEPKPDKAVAIVQKLLGLLASTNADIRFLHVGEEVPEFSALSGSMNLQEIVLRSGDTVNAIVQFAKKISADLGAVPTAGRNGFLDAVTGSTSERILRRAPCPVLAVPV